jgi:hypothetical protein
MHEFMNVLTAHRISEIDKVISKAKETFKDYRPLFNGNRWICDREAAEFLKVSRHTLFTYRQKGLLPYVLLCGKILYRERDLEELLQRNYVAHKKSYDVPMIEGFR